MKSLPVILILLLLAGYIIYAFSITKNKPTENEIKDFMQNSETLTLRNFTFLDSETETYSHPFGFYTKVRKRRTALLQSADYSKCFSLDVYDTRRSIDTARLSKKEIYIVVNKTDLNNSKYGSKESPVPVLLFYTNKEYINYYVSKDLYYLGVQEYMTYIREK